jgi:hypothetical protein
MGRTSKGFTRQMAPSSVGLVVVALAMAEFVGGFTVGKFVDAHGQIASLTIGATVAAGVRISCSLVVISLS